MEQAGEQGAEWGFVHALVSRQLETVLHRSSERLLVTVWGSGSTPTHVPRAGLTRWFQARDALTDGGVHTRVLGTLDASGTTVALLQHSLERQGRACSYESVDRWTFREGKAVAWFSRPVNPHEYADAWGLRRPEALSPVYDTHAWWKVADDDMDSVQEGH
jgi:hypothetical protein